MAKLDNKDLRRTMTFAMWLATSAFIGAAAATAWIDAGRLEASSTTVLMLMLASAACVVAAIKLPKATNRPWVSGKLEKPADIAKDETAVSPVIAVILMVAITVVLAVTVFVLVNGLTAGQPVAGPTIAWKQDGSNLTVSQAPLNTPWADFEVTGCTGTVPSGTVDAGDSITGCDGKVLVRHKPSNSVSFEGEF